MKRPLVLVSVIALAAALPWSDSSAQNVTVTGSTTTGANPTAITGTWQGTPDLATNRSEIANDGGVYKTLMLVGNRSNGGPRRVSIWDHLSVVGTMNVTVSLSTGSLIAGGGSGLNWAAINAPTLQTASYLYSYGRICTGNSIGDCAGNGGVMLSATGSYGNAPVQLVSAGPSFINSGNVGFKTTTPTTKLQVRAGKMTAWSSNSPFGQFQIANPLVGETTLSFMSSATAVGGSPVSVTRWVMGTSLFGGEANKLVVGNMEGGPRLSVDGLGRVGMGVLTTGYRLQVAGTGAATTRVTLSSRQFKQDIEAVDRAARAELAQQIAALRVARYRYRPEQDGDGRRRIGLIAEDLPRNLVSSDGKAVDLYNLTSAATAAVQELRVDQAELARDLRGRSQKLRALERRLGAKGSR